MAVGTTVTVSGLAITSLSITGNVDTTITESGTANTVPQLRTAYNPRHELSLEAIDDGYTPGNVVTAKGYGFIVNSVERRRTLGDVSKLSIRGVYYPGIT